MITAWKYDLSYEKLATSFCLQIISLQWNGQSVHQATTWIHQVTYARYMNRFILTGRKCCSLFWNHLHRRTTPKHCVCCALGYHGVNSSYHTSFVMVYRVFSEVAIKGHCFPKTLYQPSPRLGFSSDLGASLRIHANTAVFSLDSFPVLMVRLFLFRVGSLLALFALLVWEAFYRPSGDSFTGTYNRKTKITQVYCVFIYCKVILNMLNQPICIFCRKYQFQTP